MSRKRKMRSDNIKVNTWNKSITKSFIPGKSNEVHLPKETNTSKEEAQAKETFIRAKG